MSENFENISLNEKLKGYQNKLLQLTRTNRCVCLSKIHVKSNFDLSRLVENHSKKIDQLVEQSFKRKKSICVLPDSDISEESDVMRRHLKSLTRNIKQLEDETGSQYFYFGFPFLEGHFAKNHYVRGPLALFPISVYHSREKNTSGWYIKFIDSAPIFNHTLFAALEKIGGYKMSETFESDFEDIISGFENSNSFEKEFINSLSLLLEKNGLTLVSNSENNEKTLTLKNTLKDEIDSMEFQSLKISNYKIIGSFPQGESAIYHDYDNLISKIQDGDQNKLIADLVGETDSPPEFEEDVNDVNLEDLDNVSDTELNLVLPSDSSQDQVVLASQNRKITLVRGPPGTGKSQVIVNVISNALSKGQTVLVVCQKRAALEVVHQRLAEKNLDRYTVLLNKEKEDRAKMYLQLKQILDGTGNFVDEKKSLLETTSRNIDDLIKKHSEIAYSLSKEYFGGITVRDLYTKVSPGHLKKLNLDEFINDITDPELDNFLFNLSQIEENYKKFEDKNYAWKNRKNFTKADSSTRNKIDKILSTILTKTENYIILSDKQNQNILVNLALKYSELTDTIKNLKDEIQKNDKTVKQIQSQTNLSISLDNLQELILCVDAGMVLWNGFRNLDKINSMKSNHIVEETREKQVELLNVISEPTKKSIWKKLTDSDTKRKNKIKKDFLERSVNSDKSIEDLKNLLQNGLELWDLVINPLQKEYIFEKSFVLSDSNSQNHLLQTLKSLNQNQIQLEQSLDKLQSTTESLCQIFQDHELIFDATEPASQLLLKTNNGNEILQGIDDLSEFVNDEEIQIIKDKTSNMADLSSHIQNLSKHLSDFDRLQSHDLRKSNLTPKEQHILEQCVLIDTDEKWSDLVRQEIYYHWIDIIEQDHPILKAGHFDDYKQNQEQLAKLLEQKSDLIVKKIINSIESNADFRPGQGKKRTSRETDYHELNHELGKKRRVKPVRKLLEKYEHILFDIAPCWLASPDMVSNIFPLEQNMFDLIIVDEASQLAAERALPFLYRGGRIVIAGDEKQLKPHDLFKIKETDDDEDEDDDTLSIESLLLLAKKRVGSITLRWHYRSQWQELIDFSNHAFYNGILLVSPNVYPAPPKPPIEWVDCPNGLWENRSNIEEASKVVDTLYDILQDHKNQDKPPTIGIITFNDEQRNIIMDEIDSRQKKDPMFDELYKTIETPASGKKDDEIFVRNIENVQGDERDIIIFSIGYAKDTEGNFRLSFGSLNKDGGENRLNVAITRASKKIIVVCSIDPRDMKVEGTKNSGPKRLKDFLVYAKAVHDGDDESVKQILESLSSGMNRNTSQTKQFDSDFEEMVHDKLENLGYKVDTQVGQSGYRIDLAVVHPHDSGKYILGVECDGAMFHSGKSVRERDVMRQKFLERRGWNIDRIWSRTWWRSSDQEIQRIKEKIDSLVALESPKIEK